jgi:hypothetical protein
MDATHMLKIGEDFPEEVVRTSENNMLCTVPHITLTTEEQEQIEDILKVAN